MSLSLELARWQAMPSGYVASDQELATLVSHAEGASADEVTDAGLWSALNKVLHQHGGFSGTAKEITDKIAALMRDARFKADFGDHPKDPRHFVQLFTSRRDVELTYTGQFIMGGQERVAQYVENDVKLCCHTHGLKHDPYLTALANWRMNEQPRLLAKAYNEVRFQPGLDDGWSELTKFVDLLVTDTGDAKITARNRRGATGLPPEKWSSVN